VFENQREVAGKITHETRFNITSLALKAEAIYPIIHAHGTIENSLQCGMDMVFRHDEIWQASQLHESFSRFR
jgi:hypothetical protein